MRIWRVKILVFSDNWERIVNAGRRMGVERGKNGRIAVCGGCRSAQMICAVRSTPEASCR